MTQTKKRIGFGLIAVTVSMLFFTAFTAPTHAVVPPPTTPSPTPTTYSTLTSSDLLEVDDFGNTIGDVAGLGTADLRTTIGQLIRVILAFLGVIAVVIIIWGGFKWMTSGGATEKVGDARKLIIMGIVGLAITLSAYAIAQFVISSLATATGLTS